MRRPIKSRPLRVLRALMIPAILLGMMLYVWLGMVWAELRGE